MTNRKEANSLTKGEQDRYLNGVKQLLAAPGNPYGQLVAIHGDMSHDMHGMDATGVQRFLPWHRDYLLQFEKMLQAIDPLTFIPYFDWTRNTSVPAWIQGFQPTVNVPGYGAVIVRRNPSIPAVKNTTPATSQNEYTGFTTRLESGPPGNGPHGDVHMELGVVSGRREAMANIRISPADPIFWLHHGMIDKVWADWQAAHPGKHPTLSGAAAILDPWTEKETDVRSISALGYAYV